VNFQIPSNGERFEIPDDWWAFAEMEKFDRQDRPFYYYGGQSGADEAEAVDILTVQPPTRNAGTPLFKRHKLVPHAVRTDLPGMQPAACPGRAQSAGLDYAYQVTNGVHRYYASIAVGYPMLPALVR